MGGEGRGEAVATFHGVHCPVSPATRKRCVAELVGTLTFPLVLLPFLVRTCTVGMLTFGAAQASLRSVTSHPSRECRA